MFQRFSTIHKGSVVISYGCYTRRINFVVGFLTKELFQKICQFDNFILFSTKGKKISPTKNNLIKTFLLFLFLNCKKYFLKHVP